MGGSKSQHMDPEFEQLPDVEKRRLYVRRLRDIGIYTYVMKPFEANFHVAPVYTGEIGFVIAIARRPKPEDDQGYYLGLIRAKSSKGFRSQYTNMKNRFLLQMEKRVEEDPNFPCKPDTNWWIHGRESGALARKFSGSPLELLDHAMCLQYQTIVDPSEKAQLFSDLIELLLEAKTINEILKETFRGIRHLFMEGGHVSLPGNTFS